MNVNDDIALIRAHMLPEYEPALDRLVALLDERTKALEKIVTFADGRSGAIYRCEAMREIASEALARAALDKKEEEPESHFDYLGPDPNDPVGGERWGILREEESDERSEPRTFWESVQNLMDTKQGISEAGIEMGLIDLNRRVSALESGSS